jgi:hypothetical protein
VRTDICIIEKKRQVNSRSEVVVKAKKPRLL